MCTILEWQIFERICITDAYQGRECSIMYQNTRAHVRSTFLGMMPCIADGNPTAHGRRPSYGSMWQPG